MLNYETLWQGKYASVVSPEGAPYEAFHESDAIICLPVIEADKELKFAIRQEFCPPYMIKDRNSGYNKYYTVITGKVDKGEMMFDALYREIKEEAGIIVNASRYLWLVHDIPIMKSTSARALACVLRIYDYERVLPESDGTMGEDLSQTLFVDEKWFKEIMPNSKRDFLLEVMYQIYKNNAKT